MTHPLDPPAAAPRGRLTRRAAGARALAVTGLTAAALASLACAAGPRPAAQVTRLTGTGSTARAPYYVTVIPAGNVAIVRRTTTGRLVAKVRPPAGTAVLTAAAAGPGRAFLLALQRIGQPERPVRFYRMALGPGGRPGPLRLTRLPAVPVGIAGHCFVTLAGLAVTPDGRTAAVSTLSNCANGRAGPSQIEIASLASGRVLHRIRPGRDYPMWLSWTKHGALAFAWHGGVWWLPAAAVPGPREPRPRPLLPASAGARGFSQPSDPMITPGGSVVIATIGRGNRLAVAGFSVRTGRVLRMIIGPLRAPETYCGPLWASGNGQHVLAACGDGAEVSLDRGRLTRLASPWRMPFYAIPGPPFVAW